MSANFLNNFFGKPQKSLILRAFSGFPNFRFFQKMAYYTIFTPFSRKLRAMQGEFQAARWEFTHMRADLKLHLYGDSRDRMDEVHEVAWRVVL